MGVPSVPQLCDLSMLTLSRSLRVLAEGAPLTSIADHIWIEPAGRIWPGCRSTSWEVHRGPSREQGASDGIQQVCGEEPVS